MNNAGCGWLEDFESFSEAGWDKVMDLNVKSPCFWRRHFSPLEHGARHEATASVINIGSIAGVAVMLASPAGAFITGQIIVVDGGVTVLR